MRLLLCIGSIALLAAPAMAQDETNGEAQQEQTQEAETPAESPPVDGEEATEVEDREASPKAEAPPPQAAQEPAPPVDLYAFTTTPAFQEGAWTAIASTSQQIDRCTDRYSEQWPARKGSAQIEVKIGASGAIKDAKVTTSLANAYDLTVCLRDTAKSWRFPAIPAGSLATKIQVPVAKGQKFVMLKPGEEGKAEPSGKKEQGGFISFQPSMFDQNKAE